MSDIRQFIETGIPFVKRMGLKVLELAAGRVKLAAPLDGNENHIGSMYAGALFTLAEIPGGALFLTSFDARRFFPVVKEMAIRFRRPALGDVTVEMRLSAEEIARISAEAERKGKAEFQLTGEIKDADGVMVAESRGLYQIRLLKADGKTVFRMSGGR